METSWAAPFPPSGNLAGLQELDLEANQLSGAISAQLGNLANLQTLDLATNQLSGAIHPSWGTWPTCSPSTWTRTS